ncbi:MAG: lamin tail domain-containing protein [Polyangiaceae bacterium]
MSTVARRAALLALTLVGLVGCRAWSPPSHDEARHDPWALGVDPPSEGGLVDSVSHLRIEGAAGDVRPDDVWLVHGEATRTQINALVRGEPTKAFVERRVPARAFELEGDVVVAPEVALAAGGYSIVTASPSWSATFEVRDGERWSRLERAWPPRGAPSQPSAWLFCGGTRVGEPAESTLSPANLFGAFEPWIDPRCSRFVGASGTSGFVVPPPRIDCDGSVCALEPGAIDLAPAPSVEALDCASEEQRFGPGCARVLDDRLVVRAPDSALYWFVAEDGGDPMGLFSGATEPGARFVVRGLTPSSVTTLTVRTIDLGGVERSDTLSAETQAALPHLVLSEIYANPVGAEPAQEWIELYNDGVAHISLDALILRDAGGESPLPSVVLQPSAYLVLAGDALVLDDGFDPPIAAECVARMAALGKNGLGNGGEPLSIVDASGVTLTRFAPVAVPKAGSSAIRLPDASFDDDPRSFATTAKPTPCAPNEK